MVTLHALSEPTQSHVPSGSTVLTHAPCGLSSQVSLIPSETVLHARYLRILLQHSPVVLGHPGFVGDTKKCP